MVLAGAFPNNAALYAAFAAHDARFDGRVFMAVSSTHIYCRPVCRVKKPRPENCTFYSCAAAAEAAGFRPCLKCRPELAPGNSLMDASSRLAHNVALALEAGCGNAGLAGSLQALADQFGVSPRHVRRVFLAEYGVAPLQYLQTCRLLLAKQLLAETLLPITQVAMAAGFGSVRRLHALCQKHYSLTPGELRGKRKTAQEKMEKDASQGPQESITLLLGYRPPYAWEGILRFLANRAIAGVESVTEQHYSRTVTMQGGPGAREGQGGQDPHGLVRGWVQVAHVPTKNALAVTLSASLLPVLPGVLGRIRLLFDTNCEPAVIFQRIGSINQRLPGAVPLGLRLPGCYDPFEMAVRAVLGQQITVKAAGTLATRLASAFGTPLATPFPELTHTFPRAEDIMALVGDASHGDVRKATDAPGSGAVHKAAGISGSASGRIEDSLGPLGIIGARARSIAALAHALVAGTVTLGPQANPEEAQKQLCALPGFGPWTAEYIAMRALAWPDAFPHTDYGVKKALAGMTPEEVLALGETWRPWRAYATIGLWASLGKR